MPREKQPRVVYIHKSVDEDGKNPSYWTAPYPGWAEDSVYDLNEEDFDNLLKHNSGNVIVWQTDEDYDTATKLAAEDHDGFMQKYGFKAIGRDDRPVDESDDLRGKTANLFFDELAYMQKLLARAAAGKRIKKKDRPLMSRLQHFLDAKTLYLEQLEDQRKQFQK